MSEYYKIRHVASIHLDCLLDYKKSIDGLVLRLNGILNSDKVSEIIECLDMIVFYANQIQTIVWPKQGISKQGSPESDLRIKRGKLIRELLEVNSRDKKGIDASLGRNDIAHFDERLDAWIARSLSGNIGRNLIGPRSSVVSDEYNGLEIFKQYIPNEKMYIIAGKEVNIQDTVNYCGDLADKARIAIQKLRV